MLYHTIILRGTQRRFCRSKYFLAHQQIPHPLSLHVPRTKTQPGKHQNLAGLVLYSLSIVFQSIFAVRFLHTDTRLPSVRHRKSSRASSVFGCVSPMRTDSTAGSAGRDFRNDFLIYFFCDLIFFADQNICGGQSEYGNRNHANP